MIRTFLSLSVGLGLVLLLAVVVLLTRPKDDDLQGKLTYRL